MLFLNLVFELYSRMKYLNSMKHYGLAVLVITLAGCGPSTPAVAPPVMPANLVQVEPGPVDADAPEEYTTTESGLQYRIRRKSDGRKPTEMDVVRVHYRGTLEADGKIFDSSYGKFGQSMTLPMNVLIKGWAEGLQLIGEGGMIELIIRPELAYGDAAAGGIPPNSTLHFIVELLEIK